MIIQITSLNPDIVPESVQEGNQLKKLTNYGKFNNCPGV
jgi:hypothetical protein